MNITKPLGLNVLDVVEKNKCWFKVMYHGRIRKKNTLNKHKVVGWLLFQAKFLQAVRKASTSPASACQRDEMRIWTCGFFHVAGGFSPNKKGHRSIKSHT